MSNNNSVLITDAIWRKSLAAIRALSAAGIEVSAGERTYLAPALYSRHVAHRHVYPSVEQDPDGFLNWITRVAGSRKYDVLITPEESTSLFVARHISDISRHVRVPLSDHGTLSFVRNKFNLISHAQKQGIACPKTFMINTLSDIRSNINELSLPFVLKPVIGSGGRGISYVDDKNISNIRFENILKEHGPFMMQEYIPGGDYFGVSVIFNARGQMRSAFVHKKIRQYPVTGGVSTCAVSVKHPRLVEITEALLASLGWYGSANVEFKIDQRDSTPKLMEVNPRLWGSLQLAISSGINIPHLLYRLALDGDIEPHFEYRTGVKFRWFMYGELLHFFKTLTSGRKIDPDVFRLFETNGCHATWALADPLPFLGLPLSLLDYLTSAEMRKYRL